MPWKERSAKDEILWNGGADGIVSRPSKKTEEKPLNPRVYCHLPIFPMSLRNP
jgi:hypothetical protein